jgi:signal transduction histidine kinase
VTEEPGRKGWRVRPRLRSVLLLVNVVILLLPLGGVGVLRLYETELLRQTEGELVAQAAVLRAGFEDALIRGGAAPDYGALADPDSVAPSGDIQPVAARLDRAVDEVLPAAPEPAVPTTSPDALAVGAGAALRPIMQEARKTTLSGMRIVDHRGTVVASSGGEMGMSLAGRVEVRRALRGEPVSLMRTRVSTSPSPPVWSVSRGTRVRVFVALPVRRGDRVWGAVVMSRTPVDVPKALYAYRRQLAAGAIGLLLVVLLVSTLTSLTIVRPVRGLIAQTQRIARGEEAELAVGKGATLEVAQLSEAFTHMAATLEARAAYIRQFAANVSHEFKTPLTSIRGTVELMRDHLDEMAPAERERFLRNLEQDAQRLDKLVGRLLELARADVARPGEASCDAAQVAVEVAARHGVAFDGPEVAPVRMAQDLFTTVVRNLVENAVEHGGENVRVLLEVRASTVVLTVSDDGEGISAGNLSRVFDRFFTTARSSGGSGLGLAIVKALVEGHGGDVAATSEPGSTRFVVTLA